MDELIRKSACRGGGRSKGENGEGGSKGVGLGYGYFERAETLVESAEEAEGDDEVMSVGEGVEGTSNLRYRASLSEIRKSRLVKKV